MLELQGLYDPSDVLYEVGVLMELWCTAREVHSQRAIPPRD